MSVEDLTNRLRDEGITVPLISQVWALRRGTVAGGCRTKDTTGEQIVAMITGVDA